MKPREPSKELVPVQPNYEVDIRRSALIAVLALAGGLIIIIVATWGFQTVFEPHTYISAKTTL